MDKVIEYSEFKFFKTEFNFKNDKQETEYFDNILLKSSRKYVDAIDASLDEDMHVIFSWAEISLYSAVVFICMSLMAILKFDSIIPGAIFLVMSLSAIFARTILNTKFSNLAFGKTLTKSLFEMDNYGFLEEMRQEELDKLKNDSID